MRPKLEIKRARLRNLYIAKKLSLVKVGKMLNCSGPTVWEHLKRFGIPVRNHSESQKTQVVWNKRTDISQESVYDLYVIKNLSTLKIGKMFNCSYSTIIDRLKEFGISVRSPNEVRKRSIKEERLQVLYVDKKMSSIKIGKILGCSNMTICDRLRRFGIPIRDHSEAHKNPSEELLKRILKRRIPSSLEVQFQNIIDRYKLPYKYVGNGSFILGSYNPDFINTNSEKIAVEVYARYYKRRNKISIEEWKEKRLEVFESYGWKLLFFDETEVTEKNVLKLLRYKEVGRGTKE